MEMKTKLKELRLENGLTQAELGERIGVSAKIISKWENGESLPQCEHLSNLADAFNITIDELFGRTHSEKVDLKREVRKFGFDHWDKISDIKKIVSYMILGMEERQHVDIYSSKQALREISDDLERLVETDDPRPQCYNYGESDSTVHFIRDDFAITTMWKCPKQKLEAILQCDYPSMRRLFAFLALDGADRLINHLISTDENKSFTLEGLTKATDTDETTVRTLVDLLFSLRETSSETVIGKETAVLDGKETDIFTCYPGQVTKMLKTVLLASYLLTTDKGGFR